MSTVGHEPPSQAAEAVRAHLSGQSATDAYRAAGVPLPPPPASQPHPAVMMPAVPSLRSRTKRWRIATIVAGVVAVVASGIAVVAISSNGSSETVSEPAAPVVAASPPLVSPAPDPAASGKEATCGALRNGYESVANAIDERNRFNSTPWTDPAMIAATDALVDATGQLADQLEASLNSTTPSELRTAIVEYIAGLRALGISQRNHAKDMQLNGVGALYNQVVEAPLRICGIAG